MAAEAHEDELVSPLELTDRVAEFGRPRIWVLLGALVLVLVTLLLWAGLAQAPQSVPASGLITTMGGPLEVRSSTSGTVSRVFVQFGEEVQPGNTVAIVRDSEGRESRVMSPIAGQVIEVSTKTGDFVRNGDTLVTLQDGDTELEAIALMPVADSGSLAVGQLVEIAPSSVPSSDYGYLLGHVETIGTVPMTQARIDQLIGGVAGFAGPAGSPVVEVQIALAEDPGTPSGFQWSIGSGPPFALISSLPWSGEVILGRSTWLNRLLG